MQEAINLEKQTGATLLTAKLDRLSRSVAFIATLMEDKKLDFTVATMPHADKFQLHIYSALAQQEHEFISTRTKAALAEAKARGVKLGGNRPNNQARHKAVRAMADQNALRVSKFIKDHCEAGKSYQYIAEQMNTLSIPTANSGKWYAATIINNVPKARLINAPKNMSMDSFSDSNSLTPPSSRHRYIHVWTYGDNSFP